MKELISIIVPCYNEQEALPIFYSTIKPILEKLPLDHELVFVDDGSKDNTAKLLKEYAEKDEKVKYVIFSRNFGKESAMYAGLENCKGDYVAIMAYDDYVGTNEAGPNAGLPFFGEVLQLCANTVDMNRLIVGLPLYTRIWYENNDGSLSKDTREMRDIEDIVWNHGLTFEWQEDVGYDYAEYEENGARVRIWYENAKSLEAKLKLLSDYDVAGISSWRLGQETDDVWAVLEQYY